MVSKAEENVSRSLRQALAALAAGTDVPESETFRSALVGLEIFLSQVLAEVCREWRGESLDGVTPILARKTGDQVLELLGVCILISDQTVTPLHVRLRLADVADKVAWLECRLGEQGREGMVRTPYESMHKVTKRLLMLEGRIDRIDWVYKVSFGDRELDPTTARADRSASP